MKIILLFIILSMPIATMSGENRAALQRPDAKKLLSEYSTTLQLSTGQKEKASELINGMVSQYDKLMGGYSEAKEKELSDAMWSKHIDAFDVKRVKEEKGLIEKKYSLKEKADMEKLRDGLNESIRGLLDGEQIPAYEKMLSPIKKEKSARKKEQAKKEAIKREEQKNKIFKGKISGLDIPGWAFDREVSSDENGFYIEIVVARNRETGEIEKSKTCTGPHKITRDCACPSGQNQSFTGDQNGRFTNSVVRLFTCK